MTAVDRAGEPGVPAVRVDADLLWGLTGFDQRPARTAETLQLVRRGEGWRVAGEQPAGGRPAPWHAGRIRVVSGERTLVIGVGGPTNPTAAALRGYARLGDRTAAAVADLADPGWPGRLVVVVPDSTARAALLLGRPAGAMGRIAAVATAEAADGAAGADRIWLNTPVLGSLSPLARGIVLRHESLHLAVSAPSTGSTPTWLEEGYAELAGYRGSDVPLSVATSEALAETRRGTAGRGLPRDADFAGEAARLGIAYQEAHLAARYVADRYGLDRLIALYRATAAGTGQAEANIDAALGSVLGLDRAAFLAGLDRYRAALARSVG